MADYYVRSSSATERVNSTAYTLAARVVIARADAQTNFAVMRRYVYEATTPGTTGAAVPAYPTTAGGTVVDGTVIWTCRECTSWVNANVYLDYIATRPAAGDTVYVSQAHAESVAAAATFSFVGTAQNPVRIICANDAAEPPTAVATGGSITSTATNNVTISSSTYIEGLTLDAGGVVRFCGNNAVVQRYKRCKFRTTSAGSSGGFAMPNANVLTKAILEDCMFRWQAAGNSFTVQHFLEIRGGGLEAGTVAPVNFCQFGADGRGGMLLVDGFDFSQAGSTMNLVQGGSFGSGKAIFRNCKLPSAWTGALLGTGSGGPALRVEMYNCDSSDTNYRLWIEDYNGSIKSETTLIKTGGATDGAVPFSWKMTTSANANAYTTSLESAELPARWNATVGAPITVTVDILRDSLTNLTDGEVWLEVQYLGTAGFPLSVFTNDARANVLATPADQTASTATWTTTGMTNPNKQKLFVTFTPQEAGFLQAKVFLAKASTIIYVDPKLQVT